MKRETYQAKDGKKISVCVWDEVEAPVGVVQILHGMCEHVARYDEFATFLNSRGFIAFGDDHRAHGLTAEGELGIAGDGDLFEQTVSDAYELTSWAKRKYDLPIMLFGHSYGSFLAQSYLSKGAKEIRGTVLCGSAKMSGLLVWASCLISRGGLNPKKKDKPANLFASLTFRSYDKKIKQGHNAWLNRDEDAVKKYDADNMSGYVCSNGFYYWFFRGLKSINKTDYSKLRKDHNILIISGDDDYVGGKGKLVKKLAKRYTSLGFSPKLKLYEGARHELLNELNKHEVYDDILNFFKDLL